MFNPRHLKLKLVSLLVIGTSSLASANSNTQYQDLHLPFIANQGQIEQSQVNFYAPTFGGTLFVTNQNKLVYRLPLMGAVEAGEGWAFSESFIDSLATEAMGEAQSSAKVSQFKGADSSLWKSNLPTYHRVSLGEIYKGVTLKLQAQGNNIEKLFYVAPKADPKAIQISVEGVQGLKINAQKQLALQTEKGDILFTAPKAFQIIESEKRSVDVAYVINNGHYGFTVGEYDTRHELVIDPLLASTYIGGDNPNPGAQYNDDIINSVVAYGGDVYVAGVTQSTDFPTTLGAYDESYNGSLGDAFVSRLSGDLSTLIASTYLGTNYRDNVKDMVIDDSGTLYITGNAGPGFPVTLGAYTYNNLSTTSGSYITALPLNLSNIIASAIPVSGGVVTLAAGNGGLYFGGSTASPNLNVTADAFDSTCGYDGLCDPTGSYQIKTSYGFGGQLSADLSSLLHLTYLDEGHGVTGMSVSTDTSVYVSDGFRYGARDGYIARFDSGLSNLLSTAPFDAYGRTYFYDVVAGCNGYVVAVGESNNPNVLPSNGNDFDVSCGTDGACSPVGPASVPIADGIVARFSPDLQTVEGFSFVGGSADDHVRAVSLSPSGSVVLAGETKSVNFPLSSNAADSTCGTDGNCNPTGTYDNPVQDAFIMHLSADLSTLEYASYLGGSGVGIRFRVNRLI